MPSKYAPFGGKTFYLGSSLSTTATTILLSSFTEPVTGTPYTMALLNTDIAYGTIGPKTSQSEFISFTGITQNADGTATLTGVTRGLAKKYPFASDSAYKLPHAGQSVFIISDAPQVFNKYVSLENDETITGKKTFPGGGDTNAPKSGLSYAAPTNDLEYASKKYVDSVAIAGAPDATTSVKGIVKMSVAPASATGPIAVGDNDPRLPTAAQVGYIPTSAQKDALAGTGTPSGSNKFVTADTDALKELLANKSTDTALGTSDTLYPSQKAVKTYVDLRSRPLAVMTAQSALGTNPSETDVIANTSVPAGSLSAGRAIRFEAFFTFVANTGVITWKAYFGGSSVASIALTGPANNNTYNGHLMITIAYVGASSQYISGVALAVDNAASAGASAVSGNASATSAVNEASAQNVKLTYGAPANAVTNTIQGATIHLI